MVAYGWALLAIAIVLGGLSFAGYAGAYAFSANVAATLCVLISLVAFASENRTHRTS